MASSTILADSYYKFELCGFSYPIETNSHEAQLWFNRGLLQTINFNQYEGVLCFERARTYSDDCAMIYWGIAYGLSVSYNKIVFLNEEEKEKAHHASIEADRLAQNSNNESTKLLCAAIKTRFDSLPFGDYTTEHYATLNRAYLNAMKHVYETACLTPSMYGDKCLSDGSFPFHVTAGVLYAEALMQMRPWALWKDSMDETLEAKNVLENILISFPRHPGACHFYVHLMEMSSNPELAIPQSDVLRTDWLDCGHLLHMPSHIDMQVGRYNDAIICNQKGIETDLRFCEYRGYDTMYSYQGYLSHNYHMLMWACLYDGQYNIALEAAEGTKLKTPKSFLITNGHLLESFFAGKWHVWIRFGKWNEILNESLPSKEGEEESIFIVCHSTGLYAKGMAHAALGDINNAELLQKQFLKSLNVKDMDTRMQHNVKCLDQFAIAKSMLQGEILFRKWVQSLSDLKDEKKKEENDTNNIINNITYEPSLLVLNESLSCLRIAVELDDALPYDEPWGWMVPARHALAALLVEAYDFSCTCSCGMIKEDGVDTNISSLLKEAEAVYRRDLELHPHNVWSLRGLENCLKRMIPTTLTTFTTISELKNEIEKLHVQGNLAGERADIPIGASCLCALMQQKTYEDDQGVSDNKKEEGRCAAGGTCSKRLCVEPIKKN